MQHRTALISVAVLATFLLATGGTIAFVVLPASGVEEAVRKKLRSEHALVRDVRGVETGWCGEYLDPERADGVPDFEPFHAAKSSDGRCSPHSPRRSAQAMMQSIWITGSP